MAELELSQREKDALFRYQEAQRHLAELEEAVRKARAVADRTFETLVETLREKKEVSNANTRSN